MARYTFTGTITVEGVCSISEAATEIRVMLEDYADNNPDSAEISIHLDNVGKNSD